MNSIPADEELSIILAFWLLAVLLIAGLVVMADLYILWLRETENSTISTL